MAFTTQTIPLNAFGAGTVNANEQNSAWLQFTPNRIIVVYSQTAPVARMFTLIDNPNGTDAASVPNVSQIVFQDNTDITTAQTTSLIKLNDTTFACMWVATDGQVKADVFTISGNTLTKVASQAFGLPGLGFRIPPFYNRFCRSVVFGRLSENTIIGANLSFLTRTNGYYSWMSDYFQTIKQWRLIWNPTTSVLTFAAIADIEPSNRGVEYAASFQSGISFRNYSLDLLPSRVDGSAILDIATRNTYYPGTRVEGLQARMLYRLVSNNYVAIENRPLYADLVDLRATQRIEASWNAMTLYGTNSSSVIQNYLVYPQPTAGDMATTMPFALVLNDDYYAVMDYRIYATTPFYFKIFRVVDSAWLEASAASQGQYGMTITPPMALNPKTSSNRPVVTAAGNIMWAGAPLGTGGNTKFAYIVLRQPTLPS